MITIQNNTAKPITQVIVRNIASEDLTYDQKHYKGNKNKTTTTKQITANQQKLGYEFKGDESNILVDLPTSLTPGASTQINVEVQTDVPWRKDRFGYQAIAGGKIYNLSFCFPYLSDYRNGKWNYHPYNDEGETVILQLAIIKLRSTHQNLTKS